MTTALLVAAVGSAIAKRRSWEEWGRSIRLAFVIPLAEMTLGLAVCGIGYIKCPSGHINQGGDHLLLLPDRGGNSPTQSA